MKFSKFLEFKYLEWQQNVGRKTVKEFAAYIGVSTSTISTRARRIKIQQGFEADLYTATEASKLITTIEKDIETLTNQITHLENHTQANQNLATLAQNNPADIAEWIKNDSPAIVRHLLTTLCESITITPKTYKIKIKFR